MQTIEKRVIEDFRKIIQGKTRGELCEIMIALYKEGYDEDVFELARVDNDEEVEIMTMRYLTDYIACSFIDGLDRWCEIPSEEEYQEIIKELDIK